MSGMSSIENLFAQLQAARREIESLRAENNRLRTIIDDNKVRSERSEQILDEDIKKFTLLRDQLKIMSGR